MRWYQRLNPLFTDPEYRVYLAILATATLLLTANLYWQGRYESEDGSTATTLGTSLRHAMFVSVSIMTTTGFGTEDFTTWSEFAKGLLLLLMFVGGCSGSTGGGVMPVLQGNMDHFVWVTLTDEGPVFANLMLDGVWGEAGPPPGERMWPTGE